MIYSSGCQCVDSGTDGVYCWFHDSKCEDVLPYVDQVESTGKQQRLAAGVPPPSLPPPPLPPPPLPPPSYSLRTHPVPRSLPAGQPCGSSTVHRTKCWHVYDWFQAMNSQWGTSLSNYLWLTKPNSTSPNQTKHNLTSTNQTKPNQT